MLIIMFNAILICFGNLPGKVMTKKESKKGTKTISITDSKK